jgi:flagellin
MAQTISSLTQNDALLRQLRQSGEAENKELQKQSSGQKINQARDDAAGLIISEQLLKELSALNQSARNASDGISVAQVADGALAQTEQGLQRIRELSVQAANGTLGTEARSALQQEIGQLASELDRIAETTAFNELALLSSNDAIALQIGGEAGETVTVPLTDIRPALAPVQAIDASTTAGASSALASIDSALSVIQSVRGELGASISRTASIISSNQNTAVNTAEARSRITDTDFAQSASERIKSQVQRESGVAVQGQANASAELVLRLLS